MASSTKWSDAKSSSSKNSGKFKTKTNLLSRRSPNDSLTIGKPKSLTDSWSEIYEIENAQNSGELDTLTFVEVGGSTIPQAPLRVHSLSGSGVAWDVVCSSPPSDNNHLSSSDSSGYSSTSIEKFFPFSLKKSKSFSTNNPASQRPRSRTLKSPSFNYKERRSTASSCENDCDEGRLIMDAFRAAAIVHD